jgi:4-hydroxybenzoate polyprenyltransferase
LKEKLLNFNELVMMGHSIFSFPFIFIAMIVASNGWFGFNLLFLGVLAAFTARNFAMSFNRYVDVEMDVLNERTKNRPSVDGRIAKHEVLIFMLVNAASFVVVTFFVNTLAFILSFPILIVLAAYSYFKRFSESAHLILGFTLALAPMAGAIAVLETVPFWSIVLALGVMFWVAGFDILYSLQDMDFDKKMGLFSIPSRFGASKSLLIAESFHVLTIAFWLIFVIQASLGFFGYLAVVFAAIMLSYEHRLVREDFSHINKAFFTVNGYLGIVFLALIILDRLVS